MKIAHTEADPVAKDSPNKLTKVAATSERSADAVRKSLQDVNKAADAVSELQHRSVRESVSSMTEFGQLFITLLNEQMRHNLSMATAFGRTASWHEMVEAQNDFVRASFERMNQLNRRYLEIVQVSMRPMAPSTRM